MSFPSTIPYRSSINYGPIFWVPRRSSVRPTLDKQTTSHTTKAPWE